jgi:hypothetical protein
MPKKRKNTTPNFFPSERVNQAEVFGLLFLNRESHAIAPLVTQNDKLQPTAICNQARYSHSAFYFTSDGTPYFTRSVGRAETIPRADRLLASVPANKKTGV